jgi:hypothetical protein
MFEGIKPKFKAPTWSLLRSFLRLPTMGRVSSRNTDHRLTEHGFTGRLKTGVNPQALERARTKYSVYANAHHIRVTCS